jgi:DNA-binding MarR family transcriptional regulator
MIIYYQYENIPNKIYIPKRNTEVKDNVMEPIPDPQQVRAALDFVMFLGDGLARRSQCFEEEADSSPEEIGVMSVLAQRGPLMVKEIAQARPALRLSKLTRVLDSLETQGYITRTLNREDRRSFTVTLTEPGRLQFGKFVQNMDTLVQGILIALTPTERLVLIELFAKIRANWPNITTGREKGSCVSSWHSF